MHPETSRQKLRRTIRTERRAASWPASGAAAVAAGVVATLIILAPAGAEAAPPPGYYASVDTSTSALLRSTLHNVIDDHTRYPYSASTTDTWNILEQADQDPANAANILDVYRNRSFAKFGGGSGPYNREHTWPNSYGFPDDGDGNYPYTDCHHLFLCDVSYNSDRGNLPYGACAPGATERITDSNGGQGGGAGVFPGNSNWFNGTVWQTWRGRKGDVARAILYLDVRYEGGTHGVTHVTEPNLIVTDNASLITTTGSNAATAYMGMLSVLLQWNAEDPVDARERTRNDVVYSYQGNRNPFIDHPEWVNALYVTSTGPTIATITDVPADQGGQLEVQWSRNSLDVVGSVAPIARYSVQRLQGTWVEVGTQPATQSASYALVVPTNDIASPSNPQPWSPYRVVAIETGGTTRPSNSMNAYSVDNLAPPAPVVTLDTSGVPWVLSWTLPAIPDLGQACVFRGDASGFVPGSPLACSGGTNYLEFDTRTHYYVVRFTDTHGNSGPFSTEVGSVATDLAGSPAPPTGIMQVYPNPMRLAGRVAFALSAPGAVRIDVYSADGRLVRTLLDGVRGAGRAEVGWDGTDHDGRRLASGSYLVRLESRGSTDTRKILLFQ